MSESSSSESPTGRRPLSCCDLTVLLALLVGTTLVGVALCCLSGKGPLGRAGAVDLRFTGSLPIGRLSATVRVGQRWIFRTTPMRSGTRGLEVWDVGSITSGIATIGVASPSGTSSALWRFRLLQDPDHADGGVIRRLGSELIQVRDGPLILCDVLAYFNSARDEVFAWVAVDRSGGDPVFPGVVRQAVWEERDRRVLEWELVSVTR